MKDFENDLIYYPNPDPVKEPRFILNYIYLFNYLFISS
jgi:hypothetical protein